MASPPPPASGQLRPLPPPPPPTPSRLPRPGGIWGPPGLSPSSRSWNFPPARTISPRLPFPQHYSSLPITSLSSVSAPALPLIFSPSPSVSLFLTSLSFLFRSEVSRKPLAFELVRAVSCPELLPHSGQGLQGCCGGRPGQSTSLDLNFLEVPHGASLLIHCPG